MTAFSRSAAAAGRAGPPRAPVRAGDSPAPGNAAVTAGSGFGACQSNTLEPVSSSPSDWLPSQSLHGPNGDGGMKQEPDAFPELPRFGQRLGKRRSDPIPRCRFPPGRFSLSVLATELNSPGGISMADLSRQLWTLPEPTKARRRRLHASLTLARGAVAGLIPRRCGSLRRASRTGGSLRSAARRRLWARVATLIEVCKMNGVEPCAWLRNMLEGIAAGHPMSRIHELLPWNFDVGAGKRPAGAVNRTEMWMLPGRHGESVRMQWRSPESEGGDEVQVRGECLVHHF